MKKTLFASLVLAAGCWACSPSAKDYKISVDQVGERSETVYAVKDPAALLYSLVSGKTTGHRTTTGEGLFSVMNSTQASGEVAVPGKDYKGQSLLSFVKQADGKAIVTHTMSMDYMAGDQVKKMENKTSYEAEFTKGSFEDLIAGKDVVLQRATKGEEMVTAQVEDTLKIGMQVVVDSATAVAQAAGKTASFGTVKIDKLSIGTLTLRGNNKKMEVITTSSHLAMSVIATVKDSPRP